MSDLMLETVVQTMVKIGLLLGFVFSLSPLLVWAERRQSAMIQDRVGPHRATLPLFGKKLRLLGLLHPLADTLKMMWKEDFVPPKADKLLHALAPIITLVPALLTFAVVPFGDLLHLDALWDVVRRVSTSEGVTWCVTDATGACGATLERGISMQVASLDVGILFAFAIAGTGVAGAAIGGYASDNKFSLLGGLRAAGQMVSYEVVLGLTLVGCFMVFGTLRLESMVQWQSEHMWGIAVQPFAFILYLIAAIAETKRIPFDVPEGESELVGGYFTEYSGMKFGMFFMGEFIEVILLASLAATLFFGGWHMPGLAEDGLRIGAMHVPLVHGVVVAMQLGGFVLKVVLLIWLQLMLRWSLPRFRYDQIMRLCWKYLLPLALVNVFITGVVLLSFGWPS